MKQAATHQLTTERGSGESREAFEPIMHPLLDPSIEPRWIYLPLPSSYLRVGGNSYWEAAPTNIIAAGGREGSGWDKLP